MIIKDKEFVPYLKEKKLKSRCAILAEEIKCQYKDKNPLFLSVLNGSFVFSSDLIRHFDFPMEIHFIKLASYDKTQSTGNVKEILGLPTDLANRHVIILEDIVDTGNTLKYLMQKMSEHNAASIEIAAMFMKPEIFKNKYPVQYVGFEIPDKFVVGYGLDYDGFGRNLKDLYQLKN
jgi:hypoxanthine phosphoribosyltransferase